MSTTPAARSASSRRCSSPETRAATIQSVRAEYRKVAEAHERSEAEKIRVPLAKARANALQARLVRLSPRRRRASSARARFEWSDLAELARYIDWTPFFQTWELKGRYPAILDDPEQGAAARALFDDAQAMLKRIIDERWFTPKAVVGFWPAARRRRRHPPLRRRVARDADRDAVHAAPATREARRAAQSRAGRFRRARSSGARDYVGAFVVTAGLEDEAIAKRFEHANDDYSSIMVKALADRFAEALRRGDARARAARALGLCAGRSLHARRIDRRALSRHPPGARLSRAARPHRKGDSVPPARRRARDRRQAHRELRHVAGLLGVAASISPIPRRIISASPRSSATRSRTTRRARAWPSPRSSAGSGRS